MKSKLAFVRQPDSIPRKTAFSLRCYRSYPFARYHKTRIEKADWKQQHFQSAYRRAKPNTIPDRSSRAILLGGLFVWG
jgi:hypothetical protein